MIGPVLYQELMLAGRRSQPQVLRWVYAGWLVIQVTIVLYLWLFALPMTGSQAATEVASGYVEFFIVQQLIIMSLAVPAFAAGCITEEKASGTLQYLLTSDLTSREIILGKLVARSFQIGVLLLVGLPVFCFLGVFAGVEPLTLLAVIGTTVPPLVALVAASLLASVWSTQTRNAALGLYGVVGLGFLAVLWLGGVLNYLNPLYVLEPAWGAGGRSGAAAMLGRLLGGLIAWGTIAGVCVTLATWRLRPAYRRQIEGEGKKRKAHWWRAGRPPVSDQPVPWKERNVDGLAPAAFLRRFPRWLGVLAVFVAATASSTLILWSYANPRLTFDAMVGQIARLDFFDLFDRAEEGFQIQGVIVMLLASLLVGIRCSGAVSGEREKQTWEALLLTPLPAKQLIRGKLWGIMGASYVFVFAYAVPALSLAVVGGLSSISLSLVRGLAPLFWAAIWLAVTLLAMYCIGAVGIWCSVRCRTSWRSLMWTLATGYVGGFLIYGLSSLPILIVTLLVILALVFVSEWLGLALFPNTAAGFAQFFTVFQVLSCVGLALIAWGMSRLLLSSAQKYVAFRERTMQWKQDERPDVDDLPKRRFTTVRRR